MKIIDQNRGLGWRWSQFSDQQEQNQEILTQCDSSVGLKLISGQNTHNTICLHWKRVMGFGAAIFCLYPFGAYTADIHKPMIADFWFHSPLCFVGKRPRGPETNPGAWWLPPGTPEPLPQNQAKLPGYTLQVLAFPAPRSTPKKRRKKLKTNCMSSWKFPVSKGVYTLEDEHETYKSTI